MKNNPTLKYFGPLPSYFSDLSEQNVFFKKYPPKTDGVEVDKEMKMKSESFWLSAASRALCLALDTHTSFNPWNNPTEYLLLAPGF